MPLVLSKTLLWVLGASRNNTTFASEGMEVHKK